MRSQQVNIEWEQELFGCQCEKCLATDVPADEKGYHVVTWDITARVSEFIPAKISGLPEDSYPAEGGEVDIELAECKEFKLKLGGGEFSDWVSKEELEAVEQALSDAAQSIAEDYASDDYD